tara:strand:+ start:1180 stop:1935 length:756 start_codon:yes stop_codon:yes gene_type:complete
LEWILKTRPGAVTSYPSIAVALGELAEQRGIALPFHTFVGQGEVFSDAAKTYLAQSHGLKLIDRYGSSELGVVGAQCPDGSLHHQFCEASLMEVLDFDDGKSITDGRGRLVLTPFYNYAMPLIRYENQDQVEVTSDPCVCGRTLPSIQQILGRERHVFTYTDGSRSWPFMLKHEYAPFLPSRQIQAIQKTPTDIENRFVRDEASSQQVDVPGLQTFLRARLHPSITIDLVETPEIPRSASGKYEEWITLVQ